MPESALTHEVLTAPEAARWLRLDDGAPNETAMLKRLARLIDSKQLRPALVGKFRRFTLTELRRYVQAQVERYGEVRE